MKPEYPDAPAHSPEKREPKLQKSQKRPKEREKRIDATGIEPVTRPIRRTESLSG
jgi:hypothetical protein